MPSFLSDGIDIAYEVYGEGRPILLIHGFASSGVINWVKTGWVETLQKAGWRADHHRQSRPRQVAQALRPKALFRPRHGRRRGAAARPARASSAAGDGLFDGRADLRLSGAAPSRAGRAARSGAAWGSTSSPGSRIPRRSSPR